MNNKGQTLIFFVVILPILLCIFMLIIDLCTMNYEKNKLDNLAYDVMEYKLKGKTDEKVINYIKYSDKDIAYNIYQNKVILQKEYKPIFIKIGSSKIKSVYTGYTINNKNVIKKGDSNE